MTPRGGGGGSPEPSRSAASWLQLVVFVLSVAIHVLSITAIPRGLYLDECSIGLNARLIAQDGIDEHAVSFPLFFEAFGEYKNPAYIYLMAVVYKLVGYSVWSTRMTSFLSWLCGSCLLYMLARARWRDASTRLYVLISLAFTPWLFALSRVSFEIIVLYPFVALYLYAVQRGFERRSLVWAGVAGAALGGSVYAYSTFRLLAPLQMLATVACYGSRRNVRLLVAFCLCCAVAVVPFAAFLVMHPGALTGRFAGLTYLHDDAYSWLDKVSLFVDRYRGYFGTEFLFVSGDPNPRHHSGCFGQFLATTPVLALLGLVAALRSRQLFRDRFVCLVVLGALLAPIAAALMVEYNHSLRTFSLCFFMVVLAGHGAHQLSRARLGRFVVTAAIGLTGAQAALYVQDYFRDFPARSIAAFETYGFQQTLQLARTHAQARGGRVIVEAPAAIDRAIFRYYDPMLAPDAVSVVAGSRADLLPRDVLLAHTPPPAGSAQARLLPERSTYSITHGW